MDICFADKVTNPVHVRLYIMSDIAELERVIQLTEKFEDEIAQLFQSSKFGNDNKSVAILTTYSIANEHALAIRELTRLRLLTSAMAILRLQFEAVVKELWILYIASDVAIDKLVAPLTLENEQAANNSLPTCTTMLNEIEKKGPAGLYRHLSEFKENSWRPLNSFVHTGIHAVNRHRAGYPATLMSSVIKQSNNLTNMTVIALAELLKDGDLIKSVATLYKKHSECLQLSI